MEIAVEKSSLAPEELPGKSDKVLKAEIALTVSLFLVDVIPEVATLLVRGLSPKRLPDRLINLLNIDLLREHDGNIDPDTDCCTNLGTRERATRCSECAARETTFSS
jgi:hypothetical protein